MISPHSPSPVIHGQRISRQLPSSTGTCSPASTLSLGLWHRDGNFIIPKDLHVVTGLSGEVSCITQVNHFTLRPFMSSSVIDDNIIVRLMP